MAVTRNIFWGRLPPQQIKMCQITMPQPQSTQNNFVSTYGSVGGRLFSDQGFCSMRLGVNSRVPFALPQISYVLT